MDPAKQLVVAISLLDENRTDPLHAGVELAVKVLSNIISAPAEPKFRTLRTTNPKVKDTLWTLRGGRLALLAAGFAESGESIVMDAPDISRVETVVSALKQLLITRAAKDEAAKAAHAESVKVAQAAAVEARSNMRAGINDDAATRREPGWKAKVSAAASKNGGQITTASDIGATGDGCC